MEKEIQTEVANVAEASQVSFTEKPVLLQTKCNAVTLPVIKKKGDPPIYRINHISLSCTLKSETIWTKTKQNCFLGIISDWWQWLLQIASIFEGTCRATDLRLIVCVCVCG